MIELPEVTLPSWAAGINLLGEIKLEGLLAAALLLVLGPRVSELARADVADFAAGGARPEDAEQAWNDVDELRREWAASVSPCSSTPCSSG